MSNHQSLTLSLVLSLGIILTACSKKNDVQQNGEATPAPVAQTTAKAESTATEEDPEVTQKKAAIQFALMEDKIKNDPKGQWAVSAKASSTYASDVADTAAGYHPFRATGAPDTQSVGDKDTAWATKESDAGLEWIELEYAKPVNATEIKIRQNNAPGAIISVDIFDESGAAHNIWQGPDLTKYGSNISWLPITFEKTTFKTQRIKITLATNAVSGWNEIDAVQLIGE